MRIFWSAFFWCCLVAGLWADLTVDGTLEVSWDGMASTRERIGTSLLSPDFDLGAALVIDGDGKFGPDIANWRGRQTFFDTYFLLDQGYSTVRWNHLTLRLGRFPQAEEFDSPYSLFLNGDHPSLMGALYRYDDGRFTFENRWIELNRDSDFLTPTATPEAWRATGATGFPDRGASLKTLTFRWGTQRWGIEDAAVYTGRSFDGEYFLSPMPSYFTQYVKGTSGRPWTTGANENNLIGFFWDWKEPDFTVGAQVLVDDFSLHFLLPDRVPNNPWKVAWTVGGTWTSEWGTWGVFHAGATEYTFEPYSSVLGQEARTAYGYTLYPDVEYAVGDQWRSLSVEDNSLGYLHGENNAALMVTHRWEPRRGLVWSTQVEVLVAGSNSPTNPWHDGTLAKEYGTRWLEEAVLERSLVATSGLVWSLGAGRVWVTVKAGWEWNRLALRSPVGTGAGDSPIDRYGKLWSPSDQGGPVGAVTVGGSWALDLSALFWGDDHG